MSRAADGKTWPLGPAPHNTVGDDEEAGRRGQRSPESAASSLLVPGAGGLSSFARGCHSHSKPSFAWPWRGQARLCEAGTPDLWTGGLGGASGEQLATPRQNSGCSSERVACGTCEPSTTPHTAAPLCPGSAQSTAAQAVPAVSDLSLHGPFHSTWPQGLRTRMSSTLWPRKST